MERQQIGVIKSLFRYPVKSMRGEQHTEFRIDMAGIVGDRAYALCESNGRIVTAKNWSLMLECRAYYDDAPRPGNPPLLWITLPDGRTIDAQSPDVSTILSETLKHTVTLERRLTDPSSRAEYDLDGNTIFGDVPVEQVVQGLTAATMPTSWAMLSGSLFDEFSITLLATGTLTHLNKLAGDNVKFDVRRFRPNILVETEAGTEGFVEDGWLGGTIEIGSSVRLGQIKSNIRCVMTTHRQADLERDMRVIRTAAQYHRNYVGVGAAIEAVGTVRVGDPVVLQL